MHNRRDLFEESVTSNRRHWFDKQDLNHYNILLLARKYFCRLFY